MTYVRVARVEEEDIVQDISSVSVVNGDQYQNCLQHLEQRQGGTVNMCRHHMYIHVQYMYVQLHVHVYTCIYMYTCTNVHWVD